MISRVGGTMQWQTEMVAYAPEQFRRPGDICSSFDRDADQVVGRSYELSLGELGPLA